MDYNIKKVAVIGSGVMGSGIAALFAGAGAEVILLDIVPDAKGSDVDIESRSFRNSLAENAKKQLSKSKALYTKKHLDSIVAGNLEDDLVKLGDCDLIIEVIIENLAIKKLLFEKVVKYRKANSIIATNTSGISISSIMEDFDEEFRKSFIGMHFFNPPRFMKLLEIVPSDETDDKVVQAIKRFSTLRLGKGVVMAKDTPNFIGNRIGAQAVVAAMKTGMEFGFDIEKVDMLTGTIIGRPKTGTYKLADMVGLDILDHVSNNVISAFGNDDYELHNSEFPAIVKEMIGLGQLGSKTKAGFYKSLKTDMGRKKLVWDLDKGGYREVVKPSTDIDVSILKTDLLEERMKKIVWGDNADNGFVWEVLKSTLLYSANKIPEITEDFKEIDNAMKWGYNWELGPFEIWDAIGVKASVERMVEEGESVPQWLTDMLKYDEFTFYSDSDLDVPYISLDKSEQAEIIKGNESACIKDIGEGVLCLEFKSKGNSINEGVIDMISEASELVENNPYKGLVVANHGVNFSIGADINMIAGLAADKEWKKIEDLIKRLQTMGMKLKYLSKPVVTCAHGMTLGGGAEIAMSGHKQFISAETYMGLVELGVGLVPAGGGTKEILFRNSLDLGKGASQLARTEALKKGWESIVMAKVSSSGFDALEKKYIMDSDRIIMNKDYQIDAAKREVVNLAETGYIPNRRSEITVAGTSGKAVLVNNVEYMKESGFISDYDAFLCKKVANIMTGGNALPGTSLKEEKILELEKEAFLSLCGEEKTLNRIEHMLKKGKPLRN